MRDRLTTAAGALVALAIFAALLLVDRQTPPTRPISDEAGLNGYRALHDWLLASGVPVASHRERLAGAATTDAARDDGPATTPLAATYTGGDHLFLTTMPHHTRMRSDEVGALKHWVAEGNTLLVLAALNDTPEWAERLSTAPFLIDDLESLTDLKFTAVVDGDGDAVTAGTRGRTMPIKLGAVDAHPLAAGIDGLEGETDAPASLWQVESATSGPRLRLAVFRGQDLAQDVDAAWQIRHGRGTIFVVSLGSLLTNRVVGRAGNAALFANLLYYHLGPGKTVIFDDLHQGLSAVYDPQAFFADRRLHVSILFVLVLWLVYMAGTWNRLAPVREAAVQPGQQDFVHAAGGFLARKLDPVDAGRLLFASWFANFDGRQAAFDKPPWPKLDGNPAMDKELLGQLKASHARLEAGRRENLTRLRNRIRRAAGQDRG